MNWYFKDFCCQINLLIEVENHCFLLFCRVRVALFIFCFIYSNFVNLDSMKTRMIIFLYIDFRNILWNLTYDIVCLDRCNFNFVIPGWMIFVIYFFFINEILGFHLRLSHDGKNDNKSRILVHFSRLIRDEKPTKNSTQLRHFLWNRKGIFIKI